MGMKVGEAKDQVLPLIEQDIEQLPVPMELDRSSPDSDPYKFSLAGRTARVIHPWDGFYVKINPDWFNGSMEPPNLSRGEFYWYVLALEAGATGTIRSYYICDYERMREFVLDFDAPTRVEHEKSSNWRGEIHVLDEGRGYFRWGDEPADELNRPNRFIRLRNVVDALPTLEEYINIHVEEQGIDEIAALVDLRKQRESYATLEKTERDAVVQSRLGQGRFRRALVDYWQGCAVTGCKTMELLRASHIKPWRVSSNEERLDPANGLLLTPNLDAAFDQGLISFDDEGRILISDLLDKDGAKGLGIEGSMRMSRIESEHRKYLSFHRNSIFAS